MTVPLDVASAALAQLKLGGVLMPGIIPKGGITGWSLKTAWKVAKGKGSDGASLTDEGDDPPKGKVKLQLYRPEHHVEWASAYVMLRAARAAKTALDLGQPIINALEVTSVVVEEIGQLTEIATGLWEVELALLKWLPSPKAAGGKPSGSAADSAGSPEGGAQGDAATEKSAAEQEFEALAEEALS